MKRVRLSTGPEAPPPRKSNTILNRRMAKRFCKLLLRGLPADGVCDYLGIASTTYWQWIRKGEQFLDGNGQPEKYAKYGEFVLLFRKALAKYRLRTLDNLHRPGNQYWAKDMTILERRDRKSFGKYDPAGGTEDQFDPQEKFL